MRWLRFLALFSLGSIAAASPAAAAWLRASSPHFLIYSEVGEDKLREQAIDLERFDAMLRLFHNTATSDDAPFNKVTVYVVPNIEVIRRLSRDKGAAGFYVPRATGSVAFTPRSAGSGDVGDLSPRIVLSHEYAHHFLLGNYAIAYPAWFSEGYAEFASTAMKKSGAYWLGMAANHRAYGLMYGTGLTARQLFDPPARMNDMQREALYGRGWLLTHYALFDKTRRGQLATFLTLFNKDVPAVDAAERSFGDLKVLDSDLGRYLGKGRLPAIRVPPEQLPDPVVEVRALSAGEAAMIDHRIRSTAGVDRKTAPPLYAAAKPIAARFSNDSVAQGWFAEIAFDAGQLDDADKAADAAIAADPKSSQGLLYKARVAMARALAAKSHDEKQWSDARSFIIRANRAQISDAAALKLFYESFLLEGKSPRESAKTGLYRAMQIVPQDRETRFMAARQMILDDRIEEAKGALRPLAADPHGGDDNPAAKLLAAIEAGKKGQAALDVLETPAAAPTQE